MHREMRNLRGFKVMIYVACLVEINKHLAMFRGAKAGDKICEIELNEILLNSIPNSCIKHAYVQGFCFECITFKAAVKTFKGMEIA